MKPSNQKISIYDETKKKILYSTKIDKFSSVHKINEMLEDKFPDKKFNLLVKYHKDKNYIKYNENDIVNHCSEFIIVFSTSKDYDDDELQFQFDDLEDLQKNKINNNYFTYNTNFYKNN